jgi:hypothetical protein
MTLHNREQTPGKRGLKTSMKKANNMNIDDRKTKIKNLEAELKKKDYDELEVLGYTVEKFNKDHIDHLSWVVYMVEGTHQRCDF